MNPQLKNKLEDLFKNYKSASHMLKGNTMILKTLHFEKIPELSKAFCLGVVFADMAKMLDVFSYPSVPEYQTIIESHRMFEDFVQGEYDR